MRPRLRNLLPVLLCGVCLIAGARQARNWINEQAAFTDLSPEVLSQMRPSQSFVIRDQRVLRFSLPPNAQRVRVLSNASLDPTWTPPESGEIKYAIHSRLLGRGEEVLYERTYHFRTAMTRWTNTVTQQSYPNAFFMGGEDQVPADTESMIIALDKVPGSPGILELRMHSSEGPVHSATVRVYQTRTVSAEEVRFSWQRMSLRDREELAADNVFPPGLMTASEIKHLLRKRWSPLAPEGVDYERRRLYVTHDFQGNKVGSEVLPRGLLSDPGLHGTFPLPEGGGRVTLTILAANSSAAAKAKGPVRIIWHGKGLGRTRTFEVEWTEPGTVFEQDLEGGVLEVIPPFEAILSATVEGPQETIDLPDAPLASSGYVCSTNQEVSFAIRHAGHRPTPYRFNLWHLPGTDTQTANADSSETAVRYEVTGPDGVGLLSGNIRSKPAPSAFDHAVLSSGESRLSESVGLYFALPPEARLIRFTAKARPFIVSAFSRPASVPREVRVPEESFAFSGTDEPVTQRGWFRLNAADHTRLIAEERVARMRRRIPPPAPDDPDLLTGNYRWQDYPPIGRFRARRFFIPRSPDAVAREEALGVTYQSIPSGEPVTVRFQGAPWTKTLSPSLAYLRDGTTPFGLKIFLNDSVGVDGQFGGRRGEIALPPMPAGETQVRIEAPQNIRFLLNHAPGLGSETWLRRTAYEVPPQGLAFLVEKPTVQSISILIQLHVTLPIQPNERFRLRAELRRADQTDFSRSIGPHAGWTFMDRVFDVRIDGETRCPVFETPNRDVSSGQTLVLPMHSDLPPGSYRLTLTPLSQAEAFIAVARTIPGIYGKRDIKIQSRSNLEK
jgi:hypothetical protein